MDTITPGDFNAIVAAICAIITTILVPSFIFLRKGYKKKKERHALVVQLPNTLAEIKEGISDIKVDQNVIKYNQQLGDQRMAKLEKRYDALETQQLKYIINDAFFSCGGDLEKMPYEMLVNAAECAAIYLSKGLNHETGARCRLIYKELERRAINIQEDEDDG